ncbi:MAG: C1 family peptidase, partial [Bacteroidales bacterium]|nr:C1 family peptidase [Bacteroidales bacterium]
MKTIKQYFTIALIALFVPLFSGCDKSEIIDEIIDILAQVFPTGWLQEEEDMDNIPEDITPFDDKDASSEEKVVDLSSKFPPIGDQGQYGTCVAWSTAYNLKTALNGIEKGWTASQLADKNNQTSPADLWMALSSSDRGSNCNGTNFEPALDAMIAKDIASLGAVAYTSINCSGSSSGKGSGNKLANYRKIASETQGLTVDNFRGYLQSGRPISIGARLGDRFMGWNSASVINSDTYNNPGMQHAYHAMVLVGYDDNKSAFRVRNSWGSSWGDNGSIWVEYDFFCKSFCFAAFVAQNVNSVSASSSDGTISSVSKGDDLLAYYAEDYELKDDPDYNREFYYEVYNAGTNDITPDKDWTVTYMLYNAKDAKKYDIIYEDYYSDKYGTDRIKWLSRPNFLSGGSYYNNYAVEKGTLAGYTIYGEEGFVITYKMPNTISGQYYLVVMADSYEKIKEVNEDN